MEVLHEKSKAGVKARSDLIHKYGTAAEKHSATRSWLNLYKYQGFERVTSNLVTFHANFGLIAVLLCGWAGGMLVSPPSNSSVLEKELIVFFGAGSFVALLATVIDCILIANTVQQIATDVALLNFLCKQKWFLRNPTFLVVLGCSQLIAQLCVAVWAGTRDSTIRWVFIVFCTYFGVLISLLLRRYRLLVYWVDATLDGSGKEDGFDEALDPARAAAYAA